MSEQDVFKTDDMALAAFISLTIAPDRFEWDGDSCYWIFPKTDNLQGLVTDFSGGNARVDPKAFNARFAKMKREMFDANKNRSAKAV